MPTRRQTLTAALGLAGATVVGLSACTKKDNPTFNEGKKEPEPKAKAAVTSPADGATDVIAAIEVVYTSTDATKTTFELTDGAGKPVTGKMHPDGKGWMPDKMLAYGTTYTATVSATGDDGKTVTAKSTFSTMAQPTNEVRFTSFVSDNAAIGTGYPLIFQMSREIPKDARAAVQRRMLVTTEPAVEGVWHWIKPNELHWRPKEFWKPGTKIFVDARVGGVECGAGFFGKRNLTLQLEAGRQLIMAIDDRSSPKVMVVTLDGKETKRIPVSLGRPTMPSSSGVTVIIEKFDKTVFDTMTDPNPENRYRTDIQYAQRLTWGGEFIHAAPWSVQHQGVRNVSHGCVNMSLENAKWLFEQTRIGDPIITSNTGRVLADGNGWTDWSKSFEEYAKGSAIPYVPPAAQPSPTASPAT